MLCKKKSRLQAACRTGRPALKSAAGFTLVELIVVIAILAILAGVGTVAYSGYIAHTNKQLDENLKNEIIYAGAVGSYANPGARGTVTVTTDGATVGGDNPEIVKQWMADAFGADWETTVRLRTDKVSIKDMRLPYGTVSEATAAALKTYMTSNFYGHEEETLTSVDGVAVAAAKFLENWVSEEKYNQQQGLSISYEEWAKQQTESMLSNLGNVVGTEFMSKYGLNEDSTYTEISNAMVLEMASKASTMTADKALNDLLSGQDSDLMTKMGLNIAMLTAYVNSDDPDPDVVNAYNEAINSNNPDAVFELAMNGITSDAFENYFSSAFATDENGAPIENTTDGTFVLDTSSDAYTDVAGYLAALQALNEYSGEFSGSLSSSNLYSSDETLALIQTILGNL